MGDTTFLHDLVAAIYIMRLQTTIRTLRRQIIICLYSKHKRYVEEHIYSSKQPRKFRATYHLLFSPLLVRDLNLLSSSVLLLERALQVVAQETKQDYYIPANDIQKVIQPNLCMWINISENQVLSNIPLGRHYQVLLLFAPLQVSFVPANSSISSMPQSTCTNALSQPINWKEMHISQL